MLIPMICSVIIAIILICNAAAKHAANSRAYAQQMAQERATAQQQYAAQLKADRANWEHEKRRKEQEAAAQQKRQEREAAAQQKRQEREAAAQQKRQEREARQAEAHALKVARARELAELAERRLQAEREAAALRKEAAQRPQAISVTTAPQQPAECLQTIPQAARDLSEEPMERPEDEASAQPAQCPQSAPTAAPANHSTAAQPDAPKPFQGEVIAFTGTIPTMTRSEAIKATTERGGRAYEHINTHCTLLVVAQRPGKNQVEQAARWNIPTITWEEWFSRAGISYRRRMVAQSMAREARTAANAA